MEQLIENTAKIQEKWTQVTLEYRLNLLPKLAEILLNEKEELAKIMVSEMHKPIKQAVAEIEKCALLCNYYQEHAALFLAPKQIKTDATESYVSYEPLGIILGIMPWNFPFWQVFRFAIPTLMAGNAVVVKHASNVPKCANTIQILFEKAGFFTGLYQNLAVSSTAVTSLIANPLIKAISLTGSEQAGIAVAETAAKYLKKCVLELGGSNAFLVLNDADSNQAVAVAVNARMQNSGQSCIAAKRFLVQEEIATKFINAFKTAVSTLKFGDAMDYSTEISSLAREDLAIDLENQVKQSIKMGAKLVLGGTRNAAFFEPTILIDVTPEMPVFKEETFGPVAAITTFKTLEEGIFLSNTSKFGLGVSVFTTDVETIKKELFKFQEGAVFINEMVKSDPRLPFGGIKYSGYGRELAEEGIKEFVNVKTVVIH